MAYEIFDCSPRAKAKIAEDAEANAKPVELEKHYRTKYPFGNLSVGQCFTIPFAEANELSVRNAASIYAKRTEKKFCVLRHNEHACLEVARIA